MRNRFLRCTQGMTVLSTRRPTVDTGGRNRIGHNSVCTWFTRQITGRLDHKRRQEGHPVADLDDQVDVPEVPQVGQWRAEELGVGAAVAPHVVGPFGHRPAAQQRHPVAAGQQPGRQLVDQHLRSPGQPVGEVPPRDEQDVPGAGRAGSPASCGPAARARGPARAAGRPRPRHVGSSFTSQLQVAG